MESNGTIFISNYIKTSLFRRNACVIYTINECDWMATYLPKTNVILYLTKIDFLIPKYVWACYIFHSVFASMSKTEEVMRWFWIENEIRVELMHISIWKMKGHFHINIWMSFNPLKMLHSIQMIQIMRWYCAKWSVNLKFMLYLIYLFVLKSIVCFLNMSENGFEFLLFSTYRIMRMPVIW